MKEKTLRALMLELLKIHRKQFAWRPMESQENGAGSLEQKAQTENGAGAISLAQCSSLFDSFCTVCSEEVMQSFSFQLIHPCTMLVYCIQLHRCMAKL